ncbi:hypothetical protein D3C76_1158160 [compost metagenome]
MLARAPCNNWPAKYRCTPFSTPVSSRLKAPHRLLQASLSATPAGNIEPVSTTGTSSPSNRNDRAAAL